MQARMFLNLYLKLDKTDKLLTNDPWECACIYVVYTFTIWMMDVGLGCIMNHISVFSLTLET